MAGAASRDCWKIVTKRPQPDLAGVPTGRGEPVCPAVSNPLWEPFKAQARLLYRYGCSLERLFPQSCARLGVPIQAPVVSL